MSIQIPNDISDSYNQVLSSEALWAVYSIAGDTLKLQEVSSSSLSDMCEWFDEGKLQFAFAKVIEPISGLGKFVFIQWCGDGVPVNRKGMFNSQSQTVSRFFTGSLLLRV
jgi:hypothetical protein